VFSIWAEETGLVGALAVIGLFVLLVARIMLIGRRAEQAQELYSAYICYGVALIFAGQAFVNMGVSSGLLPTKGLTLPFISYGGSALIVSCVMLAVVLRIAHALRAGVSPSAGGRA
jgi:cell division protein FtsW